MSFSFSAGDYISKLLHGLWKTDTSTLPTSPTQTIAKEVVTVGDYTYAANQAGGGNEPLPSDIPDGWTPPFPPWPPKWPKTEIDLALSFNVASTTFARYGEVNRMYLDCKTAAGADQPAASGAVIKVTATVDAVEVKLKITANRNFESAIYISVTNYAGTAYGFDKSFYFEVTEAQHAGTLVLKAETISYAKVVSTTTNLTVCSVYFGGYTDQTTAPTNYAIMDGGTITGHGTNTRPDFVGRYLLGSTTANVAGTGGASEHNHQTHSFTSGLSVSGTHGAHAITGETNSAVAAAGSDNWYNPGDHTHTVTDNHAHTHTMRMLTFGSAPHYPKSRVVNFVGRCMSATELNAFPQYSIIAIYAQTAAGAIAAVPSGWTVCSSDVTAVNLVDKYPAYLLLETSAASLDHAHTKYDMVTTAAGAHTHTIYYQKNNKIFATQAGAEAGTNADVTLTAGAAATHTHNATSIVNLTTDTVSREPPYVKVVYIMRSSAATTAVTNIPSNFCCWFKVSEATPTGFSQLTTNWSDRHLVGYDAINAFKYYNTLGILAAATHVHTITATFEDEPNHAHANTGQQIPALLAELVNSVTTATGTETYFIMGAEEVMADGETYAEHTHIIQGSSGGSHGHTVTSAGTEAAIGEAVTNLPTASVKLIKRS